MSTPGLLERETELLRLVQLLDDAASGSGRLVLVEGEAGVGKTSLVQAFLETSTAGAEALVGRCDPLTTPRPLAPLHDIADALGGHLQQLLRDEAPPFAVFTATLDALRAPGPVRIVVVEDIHWADGASLDLVRHLGRRLGGLHALLLLTYRTEEVPATHPALIAVGDLSSLPWASRLALGGLSRQAVASLTTDTRLDPDEVHRVTGGNAFYVTELVAAPDAKVPATVRDAILARAAALSERGRETLDTASVLGARVEPGLLVALDAMAGADECIARGVLVERDGALLFRHELARQAILGSILPGRRMRLAASALAVLRREPVAEADLARLAALAEEARDGDAAHRYAAAAARHAAAVRAHREAAAQYRRALAHAGGIGQNERARLLEGLSYEAYLTDQITEAMEARREALDIWRSLGNRTRQGEQLRWLSRLQWFRGEGAAAEEAGLAALELLEPLGASAPLAWAYSNLSQLRMLAHRHVEAVELGRRAIAAGRAVDDDAVVVHALNNVGTASIQLGDDRGWDDLRESLRLAIERGYEEHAARAAVNLYWNELDELRLDAAEETFRFGIGYCSDRDLDPWRLYLLAGRCTHLLARGDWSGATAVCDEIERGRPTSPVYRIGPLVVRGVVRARRGDPEVAPALEEAVRLAEATNELQRLGPALLARGEAAWLAGEPEAAAADFTRVRDMAAGMHVWWWSHACAWLARIGDPGAGTGEGAVGPYRLELAGRYDAAAAEWARAGCPYEEALALARTGPRGRRKALALLDGLGARVTMAVVSRALRAAGARALPRGPLRRTRANPFGLTAREVEVGELLRLGLRNADIARRLHLAPRTVDHHVAAILAKTGASTRTEAVAVLAEHEPAAER